MRWLPLVAVVGCGGRPAPVRTEVAATPIARALVADGSTLRFVTITERGATVERTVTTPAPVSEILWNAVEPAVWLAKKPGNYAMPAELEASGGPHEDEMGRITAHGYEPFPAVAWPAFTGDPDKQLTPIVALIATEHGEIWETYCDHGFPADGGVICDETSYARVMPPPVVMATKSPIEISMAWPPTPAPPGPGVTWVLRPSDKVDDLHVVTCGDVTIPDPVEPGFLGMSEVTWLVTSPPIWKSTPVLDGFMPHGDETLYEGCAVSSHYSRAIGGPGELVAILGDPLLFVLRGRVIATLPGASVLGFAP